MKSVVFALVVSMSALYVGCAQPERMVLSVAAPRGEHLAFVTQPASGGAPEQALWVVQDGKRRRVDRVDGVQHRCSRILWSPDAYAVVFVIEGSDAPAGVVVRGITEERVVPAHFSFRGLRRLDALAIDEMGSVSVPLADAPPTNPLWAPAGASPRLSVYEGGESGITLEIGALIPKESTTDALRAHFRAAGWDEQPFEWVNPTTPTAFASGWRNSPGGVIPTDTQGRPLPPSEIPKVHLWTGEWTNAQGDLVTYHLISVNGAVRGTATYYPRKVVDEVLSRLHSR